MPAQDRPISQEVIDFINRYVDSVGHLEVLLLIRANPKKEWSPQEVGAEMRSNTAAAEKQLAQLHGYGLLSIADTPDLKYVYDPRTPLLRGIAEELALAYDSRRVAIINLIYGKPLENIKSFSDAFRFRKDGE